MILYLSAADPDPVFCPVAGRFFNFDILTGYPLLPLVIMTWIPDPLDNRIYPDFSSFLVTITAVMPGGGVILIASGSIFLLPGRRIIASAFFYSRNIGINPDVRGCNSRGQKGRG